MTFYKDRFKILRKNKRWSISALAVKSGISRRSISDWENGNRIPSEKSLKKLTRALGVGLNEISDIQKELPVSDLKLKEHTKACIGMSSPLMDRYIDEFDNFQIVLDLIKNRIENNTVLTNAILSSIQTPMYIKDMQQKYLLVNDAFMKNVGLEMSIFTIGSSDKTFFSKEEAEKNYLEDEKVIKCGDELINNRGFIPGSRKTKYGLISKYPILDNQKKICGLIGIFSDITNKTGSIKEKKRLDMALNMLDDAVFYGKTDKYGKLDSVIYINDAFSDITGIKNQELIENRNAFRNIIFVDDISIFDNLYKSTTSSGKVFCRIISPKNNDIVWVKIKTYLNDKIRYFIVKIVDEKGTME